MENRPLNPYESPTPVDETALPLDADQAARGEQVGPEYRVLFVITLAIVVYVDQSVVGALYQIYTPHGLSQLLLTIASAAGLAALPLAVRRKWQGSETFPMQLGHWLLLIAGASWLGLKCSEAWYARLEALQYSPTFELGSGNTLREWNVVRAAVLLVVSSIHWLALRSLRGDRLSQGYIAATITGLYWIGLSTFLGISRGTTGIIALPVTLAMMILFGCIFVRDLLHPKTKDPMHWVGISTVVLTAIVALLNVVVAAWDLYSNTQGFEFR